MYYKEEGILAMYSHSSDPFESIYLESRAMIKYSYSKGDQVPENVIKTFSEIEKEINDYCTAHNKTLKELNSYKNIVSLSIKMGLIHSILSKLLQPANPNSIYIIESELNKNTIFNKFGCIPFIRSMMLVTILSMVTFVVVSLSPMINIQTISRSLFDSNGIELLLNFIFLLSASALGATFSAMLKANKYIVNRSFDTKHETTYWVKFIVGLLSGLIITELVPPSLFKDIGEVGKPTLALLAGFSSVDSQIKSDKIL
jgi:hypothetical protein